MNIAIVGTGAMGKITREMALLNPNIDNVFNIEPALGETLWDLENGKHKNENISVIIDFSHPDTLRNICDYVKAKEGRVGVVFATTGFSDENEREIEELGRFAPVIKSSNFSFGVYALRKIIEFAAPILEEQSDIEIIEKHHNKKIDAPSGTAKNLAKILNKNNGYVYKCGRDGVCRRQENEIGIHSIRGGNIVGEHSVIFAMNDEVIEIKHTAFSKKIFAKGAVDSAIWLKDKLPGIYNLEQVWY